MALFAFAWVLFAFNYYNPDFYQYEAIYQLGAYGSNSRMEAGFMLVIRMANKLGLSFLQFKAIIAFVGLAVIFSCFKTYVSPSYVVSIAYIIYPFLFDLIQIRMFIVVTIILYSFRFLRCFSIPNACKFILCVFIATSFQTSAIFYLSLLLAYIKNKRKILTISLLLAAVEVILFNNIVVEYLFRKFAFIGENFASGMRYVSFAKSFERLMWIYFIIYAFTLAVNFVLCDRQCDEASDFSTYNELLTKILYISIIAIPLMKLGSSFGRFYRVLLPGVYCSVSSSVDNKEGMPTRNRILKVIYLLALSSLFFYSHIYTGSNDTYNKVLLSVLENNFLINFFRP